MKIICVLVMLFVICAPATSSADPTKENAVSGIIGGIGLTHLAVYEQRLAPDGVHSGSPHVHAVTDEAYYVISGTGRAELHDLQHGFRTIDLKPGQYLQFAPLVLHRIISTDRLVILAVMGNAGLAEKGDARIYFGKKVDEDPDEFARLLALPRERGLEGALDRRDASVRAYLHLMKLWETDRPAYFAELKRFTDAHMKAVEKRKTEFADAVASGPLLWGKLFEQRLELLPEGKSVIETGFHDGAPDEAYGMCGILRPLDEQ